MSLWVLYGTGAIIGIVILSIFSSLRYKRRERRWSKDSAKVITFMGTKTKGFKGGK